MIKRDFDAAAKETYDVIVVGGGIVGSGIARDAALRGLKTLILDKVDFACGTTSRSSRLIHGGLRYLKRFELGLVRQDLRERDILLRIAPNLVHPLSFVIPITSGKPFQRVALPFGLMLYDLLYWRKSLPSHQRLTRRETLDLEPGLEPKGLSGSYLYHDCQAPFVERLCLENVLSAAERGATALNHTKVTGFLRDSSRVSGVMAQDQISGEMYQIRGRVVVNAAGHWVDTVREILGKGARSMVRRTKGIHLLTPKFCSNAIVLFALSDARLFFVIPWQNYSLIGTTDTDYTGDLDTVRAEANDVTYLLKEVQSIFPNVRSDDIYYTMAGLRALAYSKSRRPEDVSRSHKLVDHEREDGIGGFVSVLGGKITAYRAVAEQATDMVCRKLAVKVPCTTAEVPLPGAPMVSQQSLEQAASERGITPETVSHLASLYGSRFSRVLDLLSSNPKGAQRLCPHGQDILAQVQHAVEQEGALTVEDFLLRRSAVGLGPCQGLDALDLVAGEMGRLLGWNNTELQSQVEAYRAQAALGQRFRSSKPA